VKYLPLVWAGIWRKPGRAILMFLSVVNAFLLFGLLQGFVGGLSNAASGAHADLLFTTSRVSLYEPLPLSVAAGIRRVEGVRAVSPLVTFRGYYQTPRQFIRAYAVDVSQLPDATPALQVPADQLEALRKTRTGVIVSQDLAARYGWRIGQRIPLMSQVWTNEDGTRAWSFQVVGIYRADSSVLLRNAMLMSYDYLDGARQNGRETASAFILRLRSAGDADRVERAVDAMFRNSPDETRTASESQAALDAVKQIGDVGALSAAVVSAVFLALMFSVGATMHQAVRERTSELAMLKVFGLSASGLVALLVAESGVLFGVAAMIGLGLAAAAIGPITKLIGFTAIQPAPTFLWGIAAALLLALAASSLPALRAARLRIVDALAER
jgi:putative ABC transport system permease protein